MRHRNASGFSIIEMLVSLTVLLLATTGLATLLLQNSALNKSQQMTAAAQSNARNTLAMVVAKLRSAGWDPMDVGVPTVTLDPDDVDGDHTDGVNNIEIFADLNADSETDGTATDDDDMEQILIRHSGDQVLWRPKSDVSEPFVILAGNIDNDADGDGTAEPMFVPDAVPPTRLTVQITARSAAPDPVSKEFIRYTVSTDVVLRKSL